MGMVTIIAAPAAMARATWARTASPATSSPAFEAFVSQL